MATVGEIDSLLDFTASLHQSLIHQDQPTQDISVYLRSLPLYPKDLSSSDQTKLNKHGVALWNLCGRLRQTGDLLPRKELLSQDAKLPGLALKIVERAAIIQEKLGACNTYVAEYLLIRLALAWRQDRLDLAEHFFAKLQAEAGRPATSESQDWVELTFNIGRDCLEKKNGRLAVRWLERAAVLLEDHDFAGLAAGDLRLSVLHTYARALLEQEDANTGLLRARTILETLQRLYIGGNDAVLLLQLEIAIRGHAGAYSVAQGAVVHGAVSQLTLTDSHYKAIIHYIHCLRKLDPTHARELLQYYVVQRLAVHGNDQWIESALIMLVSMSTSGDCTSSVPSLETAFTEIHQRWTAPPSSEAVHGVLVLLWKRIEKLFDREEYADAAAWCKLAMHQLLSERLEYLNAGKIQRKLLQCLLEQSKPGEAREATLTMSPSVGRHPLSLYLTYCIATRLKDEDLAQGILVQAKSDGVLLSCISETLRYELEEAHNAEKASTSICKVFMTAATCVSTSRSFSLLEIDWFTKTSFDLARRFYKKWPPEIIIRFFGHVAELTLRTPADSSLAYEDKLLVEGLRKRQADAVLALAILHTTEARVAESVEAQITNYNEAQAYVHLCRQNLDPFVGHNSRNIAPEPGTSKEDYSQLAAKQITLLQVEFEAGLHVPQNESPPMSHGAKFDRLSAIVTGALKLDATAQTYAVFAEMVISAVSGDNHNSEALISVDAAAHLLRQIMSAAQGTEGYDAHQAARWIRCVIQLVLSGPSHGIESENVKLVEAVVEHAIMLAATGNPTRRKREDCEKDAAIADAESHRADVAEELEWIATTLFNLAVDYYVGEQEELGKKWARKAVELAEEFANSQKVNGDGGLLARVLREKMAELGWSV